VTPLGREGALKAAPSWLSVDLQGQEQIEPPP